MASGSGRGFERGGVADFKALLSSTNVCTMLAGHANAFGIQVEEERLEELIKVVNESAPIDSLEVVTIVDYRVDGSKLTSESAEENHPEQQRPGDGAGQIVRQGVQRGDLVALLHRAAFHHYGVRGVP